MLNFFKVNFKSDTLLLKLYLAKYFINFDFFSLASLFVLLENGFTECRFLFERIFSKENCALEDCGWSSPRPILAV